MSGMAEQSLHRRVRELEATVTAMQNAFMAQEKAMGMADVASASRDVQGADSHRYDLRLLKIAWRAHLVDRTYALELSKQGDAWRAACPLRLKQCERFRPAKCHGGNEQEFEGRVEKMVEEKYLRVCRGERRSW